eukprot:TRINITY_DN16818_c0_g1_i1.p1 TRINITY_DN16818_c0_g1~~TRINITY_DN16818_c0_g1_i1.p1  ORF type:complete len:575 (-),score=114.41 TRINITY_DN16818_c0_g1_i1:12-1616(-)
MKKIWKGLFFCYWHSDKPLVQQELALNLSGLMHSLPGLAERVTFIKVFFSTIQDSWHSIDRLRLDKFYNLITKMIMNIFKAVHLSGWDVTSAAKIASALTDTIMAKKVGGSIGITTHVCDVYLPQLAKVIQEQNKGNTVEGATLLILLDPVLHSFSYNKDKRIMKRIRQTIIDPLFSSDCFGCTMPSNFYPGLSQLCFDYAAKKDIITARRKALYGIRTNCKSRSAGNSQTSAAPTTQKTQQPEISDSDSGSSKDNLEEQIQIAAAQITVTPDPVDSVAEILLAKIEDIAKAEATTRGVSPIAVITKLRDRLNKSVEMEIDSTTRKGKDNGFLSPEQEYTAGKSPTVGTKKRRRVSDPLRLAQIASPEKMEEIEDDDLETQTSPYKEPVASPIKTPPPKNKRKLQFQDENPATQPKRKKRRKRKSKSPNNSTETTPQSSPATPNQKPTAKKMRKDTPYPTVKQNSFVRFGGPEMQEFTRTDPVTKISPSPSSVPKKVVKGILKSPSKQKKDPPSAQPVARKKRRKRSKKKKKSF